MVRLGGSDTVGYLVSRVDRTLVRRGEAALGKGFLVGAGVGLAFVGLVTTTAEGPESGIAVVLSTLVAAATTLIGTVVGGLAALSYTDNWFHFDPVTMQLIPAGVPQ